MFIVLDHGHDINAQSRSTNVTVAAFRWIWKCSTSCAMYGEAVLRASFHAGWPTLGGVPG
jgi:hypothetical protein